MYDDLGDMSFEEEYEAYLMIYDEPMPDEVWAMYRAGEIDRETLNYILDLWGNKRQKKSNTTLSTEDPHIFIGCFIIVLIALVVFILLVTP